MDWPHENSIMNDADFENVFHYQSQETTVVKYLTKDHCPISWSLTTSKDWTNWLSSLPSVHGNSGLVLILARKPGEHQSFISKLRSNQARITLEPTDDIDGTFNEKAQPSNTLENPFTSLSEHANLKANSQKARGGKRDVRQLPFEESTFRDICKRFYVHPSIARVINRADTSVFSRSMVNMATENSESSGHPAIVYHCRSSNVWADDMALTATYFPESKLTFAIVFGCNADAEMKILNRLSRAKGHVAFPLLLPGIFAEIERDRMVRIVEKTIDEIEEAIFEIGSRDTAITGTPDHEVATGTRQNRKTAWLNTTFLRNSLRMWNKQLRKMSEHVGELSTMHKELCTQNRYLGPKPIEQEGKHNEVMERTGRMIYDRLHNLMEEYEDRIHECTMSVEGMTIATQWAQGDTNVDIATATGQDSRQMRSIALVTMVFLPGTFFATLFSMTFFDWSPGEDKKSLVSGYIWIYFLVTGVFTATTLVIWWYFLSSRRKKLTSFH
nr:uncharacterized protein CTRU02_06305 [Colletotrichum truncatum]KAF6792809.1 hypothetical protein CTRU02_06305 [Colletotrichum truncatum]